MNFIVNLLSGRTVQWATAITENQTPLSFYYLSFAMELGRVIDHPVQNNEAASNLLSLCQGASTIAENSFQFRLPAKAVGMTPTYGVYVQGLAEELKDKLAAREETLNLETLIDLMICLDSCL